MQHQPQTEQHPRRFGTLVLKVIGAVLLIMVLICGGLVTYVAYNFRGWAASLAKTSVVAIVDETNLPAEQKSAIKSSVNRVADAYRQGQISHSQLTSILEHVTKGPTLALIVTESKRHDYSSLHANMDKERQKTMLLFDQFERGIVEQRIPQKKIDEIISLAGEAQKNSQHVAEEPKTEADLKPFLDAMLKAVNEAKIPAEPFQPDFGAEIDKAVNAVLGSDGSSKSTSNPAPDSKPASKQHPATQSSTRS